jgi:aminotransferase
MYERKRDLLATYLREAGTPFYLPEGAYYILADISGFGFPDDTAFAMHLVREHGVATVPGSSFYHAPPLGRDLVRFTFSKKDETLRQAGRCLQNLGRKLGRPGA